MLHLTEYHRISECVDLLLQNNTDLAKIADNYGWTVFHYMAYNNLDKIVNRFVDVCEEYVAYTYQITKIREQLFMSRHVEAGNVSVMKKLLKYFPDSWEIVDRSGRNILQLAVELEHNKKGVIRYILSNGEACKNLLIQRDKEGNTPLHLVAQLGCYVSQLMDLKFLDWEVLNNKNLTPLDVLLSTEEMTYPTFDKFMIKRTLIDDANVKNHRNLWRALKGPDIEAGNSVVEIEKANREIKEMMGTHMIVAALIATVAITAGFAVPGGFDGKQGSPIHLKKRSFRAFMVTDTLALFLSISSQQCVKTTVA